MIPSSTNQSEAEALEWGSHMPALLAAVGASSGDVLEIGIGHFSTPQLHYLCGAMNRRLVSIEQNREWHDFFCESYKSASHEFHQGEYAELLPLFSHQHWSVVFIDHSPGGKNRSDAFELFIDCSDYVIVHDYHLENEDAIKPLLSRSIYRQTVSHYQPPTLIASSKHPIHIK